MTTDIERLTQSMLAARAPEATLCPSEVARALARAQGRAEDWRDFMLSVHEAVDELVAQGQVELRWKGKPLPLRAGPYRIGGACRP